MVSIVSALQTAYNRYKSKSYKHFLICHIYGYGLVKFKQLKILGYG